MDKKDCGVYTSAIFKLVIDFCNGRCTLAKGPMGSVDLGIGDDRRSLRIVELQLMWLLIQPLNLLMFPHH